MNAALDLLVLGGGVIGLTTAYFAARDGLSVAVLDRGDFGQEASWAGAGIIPPGVPDPQLPPLELLKAVSSAAFADLSRQLCDITGIANGYCVCGGIELAEHHAVADEWRGRGCAFHLLTADELQRLEPALAPELDNALLIPGMAQLRNPRHLKALVAACSVCGVALYPHRRFERFEVHGGKVVGVRTADGTLAARHYLVAAGAWCDALLADLGVTLGVRPIRGQIALLQSDLPLTRVITCGPRYLVPRGDGLVLVGSTEEDVGYDRQPTAAGIGGLLTFAQALAPRLASASLLRCWAGLRPASPDGLPYLGHLPEHPNVLVAAGHFRAGIQLSIASAQLLVDLLQDRPPRLPTAPFRLDRPARVH
jgi:glycine oxidase